MIQALLCIYIDSAASSVQSQLTAMATPTSNHNTSQTLAFVSPPGASFSTFLRGADENYVRKKGGDGENYVRKKEGDGEIGVFGAEKYFNGGTDMDSPSPSSPRMTKTDAKNLECLKDGEEDVKITPPSALLQSVVVRSPRPTKHGKSFLFSGLACCKCYCYDSSSVDVEEVQVGEISFKRPAKGDVVQGKENKTTAAVAAAAASSKANLDHLQQVVNNKEDLFTFPTMNSTTGIRPVKVSLQGEADEIGRKSLEVFGSPVLGRRNKSLNLERKLKMLSWNGTPKVVEEYVNSKGKCSGSSSNNIIITDAESDASSDLFEIESITSKANPILSRRASDAAASGSVTPTCYAPSEASIEWSAVPASAANFSVMSDYEELRPSVTLQSPIRTYFSATINANGKAKNNKELQRRHSRVGLLDCNSPKAVKVAGDAHKANDIAGFNTKT